MNINEMEQISSIQILDKYSIDSMSFVPDNNQIHCILKSSEEAKMAIQMRVKSDLLSKVVKLIPDSFNPNDTVLIQKGVIEGIKNGNEVVELQPGQLYVINDQQVPFEKTSNGPNGILAECQGNVYGKNRINLFDKNITNTKKLLSNYIKLRNNQINNIYYMFVKKLNTYTGDSLNMKNVIAMHNLVLEQIKKGRTLNQCGIGVVSFCQTWMKEGNISKAGVIGPAQFSIMSPHFQTRFFVQNEKNLLSKCGITREMYVSYVQTIKDFTQNMQENYGIAGSGRSFINLDMLNKKLSIQGPKSSPRRSSPRRSPPRRSPPRRSPPRRSPPRRSRR